MKYDLNKWLSETKTPLYEISRQRFKCLDGTTLSIQASECHYCDPRSTNAEKYTTVEVWCINKDSDVSNSNVPESWNPYGDGSDPWAYIPIELVEEFIMSHGGPSI